MQTHPTIYAPPNSTYQENDDGATTNAGLDTNESNMIALQRASLGNVNVAAKNLREEFATYFVNEGKLSWQDQRVLRNKNSS